MVRHETVISCDNAKPHQMFLRQLRSKRGGRVVEAQTIESWQCHGDYLREEAKLQAGKLAPLGRLGQSRAFRWTALGIFVAGYVVAFFR